MHPALQTQIVTCPFCGENMEVLLDCSVDQQNYVEDCQVCCRPLVFDVNVDNAGETSVQVRYENE